MQDYEDAELDQDLGPAFATGHKAPLPLEGSGAGPAERPELRRLQQQGSAEQPSPLAFALAAETPAQLRSQASHVCARLQPCVLSARLQPCALCRATAAGLKVLLCAPTIFHLPKTQE